MPWQANCSVTGSASPTDAAAARVLIDQLHAGGLISQLNEIFDKRTGQTNLQRVVSNLVAQASGADEYDEKGKLVKRDTGDLAAIKEIFDRVEGRVPRATRSSVSQNGSTRQPSISSVNVPWQANCSATGSASPTSNGSTASIPRKS
jgi:hypothetical protein